MMTMTAHRQVNDSAVSMLSPPLSPYPDLLSLQHCKLAQANESRPSPVTTNSPSPGVDDAGDKRPINRKSGKMVTCWKSLLADPVKYYERERNLLRLYPIQKSTWSNYIYVESPNELRSRRKQRPIRARRGYSSETDITTGEAGIASPREFSESEDTKSPKRPAKKRASPGPNTSRVHDLNIAQIEDFSPPTSLLPPGKSLRAEWKGAPMDLSNDSDVHLLHPAEVHLASVLRLPADVYLDSKRRLFAEKVHRMRQGLAFRRTDSQKACRIDVNKASRLFGAFERVGWLDDELFTKYL